MKPLDHSPSPNQDGIVLISVLWIVVVLSLLITTFSASVRTAVAVNRTERSMAQVQAIADAGIELAVARLRRKEGEAWKADGRRYTMRFANARLTVRIRDANGLLDINYAPSERLLSVLEKATRASGLGRPIHDFIIARRNAATGRNGETEQTGSADPNGNDALHKLIAFRDISELLAVPGVTMPLITRLKRILTVHSAGKGINAVTAPVEVLKLLPGLSDQQVNQIVEARRSQKAKSLIEGIVSSSQNKFTADHGPAYTISVSVAGKGFARPVQTAATILLNSDPLRPYFGLSWRPVGDY